VRDGRISRVEVLRDVNLGLLFEARELAQAAALREDLGPSPEGAEPR
jgi:hypothetical protein